MIKMFLTKGEGMKEINKIFLAGLVALIVSVIGPMVSNNIAKSYDKIDYYKRYDQNFISKNKFSKIELSIDGQVNKKAKFSALSVGIFNFTSQSFENIEITFFIKPKNEGKFSVIDTYLVDRDGLSLTSHLMEGYPQVNDGVYVYKYRVPSLFKVDNAKKFNLEFKALLNSKSEPEISVSTSVGEVQEYDLSHLPGQTLNTFLATLIFIIGLATAVIILLLVVKGLTLLTKGIDKKNRKKYANSLFKEMLELKGKATISSEEELASCLGIALYNKQNNRWEKGSKFTKMMENKYDLEDYKIELASKSTVGSNDSAS